MDVSQHRTWDWQPGSLGNPVALFPLDWLLAEFEGLFEIACPK